MDTSPGCNSGLCFLLLSYFLSSQQTKHSGTRQDGSAESESLRIRVIEVKHPRVGPRKNGRYMASIKLIEYVSQSSFLISSSSLLIIPWIWEILSQQEQQPIPHDAPLTMPRRWSFEIRTAFTMDNVRAATPRQTPTIDRTKAPYISPEEVVWTTTASFLSSPHMPGSKLA
jgi:hypothetical protein